MLGLALAFSIAAAPAAADDRTLVFVDDVQAADKALGPDATALTTALCAAIGKDKRFDVLCAPDVKQILSFAATAAMVGTSGDGPGGAIQKRLDHAKDVVSALFKREGGKYVLVIKAGPKAAGAPATALYSDKAVIALEEKGDNPRAILDKMPALAARVSAALLPAAATPPPPPAPLKR